MINLLYINFNIIKLNHYKINFEYIMIIKYNIIKLYHNYFLYTFT